MTQNSLYTDPTILEANRLRKKADNLFAWSNRLGRLYKPLMVLWALFMLGTLVIGWNYFWVGRDNNLGTAVAWSISGCAMTSSIIAAILSHRAHSLYKQVSLMQQQKMVAP